HARSTRLGRDAGSRRDRRQHPPGAPSEPLAGLDPRPRRAAAARGGPRSRELRAGALDHRRREHQHCSRRGLSELGSHPVGRGRWTTAAAIINTALAVAFVSWALTLLGRDRLLNPELLELARDSGVDAGTTYTLGVVLVVCIVGGSAWDSIDGWLKTARDARR